ncbi:MAG: hypothetical protein ACOX5R_16385 [bacterium]
MMESAEILNVRRSVWLSIPGYSRGLPRSRWLATLHKAQLNSPSLSLANYGTLYAYGFVRGEDGNSDSLHAELDAVPAGDNSTYWASGGGKNYHNDWVDRNDPAANPRPFDVTPGEHFFYVATREDSASIDYLVFTNNPSLPPSAFDVITGELIDPLEDYANLSGLGIFEANADISDAPANLGAEGKAGVDTRHRKLRSQSAVEMISGITLTTSTSCTEKSVVTLTWRRMWTLMREPVPMNG